MTSTKQVKDELDIELDNFDVSNASDGFMTTYTGIKFSPLKPTPEMISVYDIAHALSLIARWGGHLKCHYSVAQHCCNVSDMSDELDKPIGLLHDASEAYIGDMIRPLKYLKQMHSVYKKIEHRIDGAIALAFGLNSIEKTQSVEVADVVQLSLENIYLKLKPSGWAFETLERYPQFKNSLPLVPWTPEKAEVEFLKRFVKLFPNVSMGKLTKY
jgi:hypothetical protein